MAEVLPTTGVVDWPIDLGGETTAPICWTQVGSPDEGPGLLVWVGGLGAGLENLAAAAPILKESAGIGTVVGVVAPIKEVVCKASNVHSALDRLIQEGIHQVPASVDPAQQPYLGGESRGGNIALEAGATGNARAIVTLCSMGLANTALGRHPLTRGLEVGRRLRQTLNHHGGRQALRDDPALKRVTKNGADEVLGIVRRGRIGSALGYAFGDARQASLLQKLVAYKQRQAEDPLFDVALHFTRGDDCFRLQENLDALEGIDCGELAIVIDGLHACIGSPTARDQLMAVGGWLQKTYQKQSSHL